MNSEARRPRFLPEAMELLSFDLTGCFTKLLRMCNFYSEDLKLQVRASLPPLDKTEAVEAWNAQANLRAGVFLHKVAEQIGEAVSRQITSWLEARYPVSRVDKSDDLIMARWVLNELKTEWDEHPSQVDVCQ